MGLNRPWFGYATVNFKLLKTLLNFLVGREGVRQATFSKLISCFNGWWQMLPITALQLPLVNLKFIFLRSLINENLCNETYNQPEYWTSCFVWLPVGAGVAICLQGVRLVLHSPLSSYNRRNLPVYIYMMKFCIFPTCHPMSSWAIAATVEERLLAIREWLAPTLAATQVCRAP